MENESEEELSQNKETKKNKQGDWRIITSWNICQCTILHLQRELGVQLDS